MRPWTSRALLPEPVLQPQKSLNHPPFHRHYYHALPLHHSHQLSTFRRSATQQASSSRCHIFWDLDNVQPTQLEDILVVAHAIRSALLDLVPQLASPSLDNKVPPSSPPPPLPRLTVFANPTTLQKFSPIKAEDTMTSSLSSEIATTTASSIPNNSSSLLNLRQAVEDILGGTLILTTERKQSVDFAMKSAMLEYAQQARKKRAVPTDTMVSAQSGDPTESENSIFKEREKRENTEKEILVIACVSDDNDYVQVLNYLGSNNNNNFSRGSTNSPFITTRSHNSSTTSSSVGMCPSNASSCVTCRTVSIGEHKRRKRPAWAAPRKLESLALPAACNAAITLSRPRIKKTVKAREAGTIHENRRGPGGGGRRDDDFTERGWGVETIWVNPKKNWKERIPIKD